MKIKLIVLPFLILSLPLLSGTDSNNEITTSYPFQVLPIEGDRISVPTILFSLYERDSTSVIEDFPMLLTPEQFYYTPLDSFKINELSDTLYFRFYHLKDFGQTTSFNIWNKEKGLSAVTAAYGFYGYKNRVDVRDWEQQLIEHWDVDSIHVLENPTFYSVKIYPPPQYYVYQIVINNGCVKSRQMKYQYLYIPRKYENDPVRSKQKSDR